MRPLFFLDEPHYHHLPGSSGPLRFRGAALAVEGPLIETLRVVEGGRVVGEAAVNEVCKELAFLPFPKAGQCRFELVVDRGEGPYELRVVYDDGREEAVFRLANPPARDLWRCIDALPKPGPELVAATQGGGDVTSYVDSMVSGVHTLESLLRASGVDPDAMQSILDIGCGTGRLLMGWHCADPRRRLAGVDINGELIAWSKANLPGEWAVCEVLPPLQHADATFDLVQLASVFTHLPLPHQKQWIAEIRRLLKPGGILVITLHGEVYSKLLLPEDLRGDYAELPTGAIGSNAFASFHSVSFAETLFEGFTRLGYFPRGRDADPPALFPIAALQDVYVFRKV